MDDLPPPTGPTQRDSLAQEVARASKEHLQERRKGPLSFLSGAFTSALLAWLSLALSRRVVAYYATHPPHYNSQVAQSIATAVKTLVVGMAFLATFSFAFVGVGLFLTFLRSLWSPTLAPAAGKSQSS